MDEKPENGSDEKAAERKRKGLDFNVMEPRSNLPFVVMIVLSLIVMAGLLIVWLKFL